jgi:excinuclease UvrABC nuclease subunit
LSFERAAEIRDQIEALKAFFSTAQQAFDPEMGDLDFLGMARAGALSVVQLYQVRSGRILGRISRVVEKEEATDEEILWAFLRDHYLEASPLPSPWSSSPSPWRTWRAWPSSSAAGRGGGWSSGSPSGARSRGS